MAPTALAVSFVLACTAATFIFINQYRSDQQTNPVVADAVVQAATKGTIAVLSYKPDTADTDFSTAKTYLTGDFLSYYDHFVQQVVSPAVHKNGVHTTATVAHAAVVQLQPDEAQVLLFVNQSTASATTTAPSMTASSIKVGLRKVDSEWLISSFDPV
ncbi:hypothetical protein [Mycobacterium aquaticum]|uniref:Twin-arginine translocation pathway signal n=1 Tax=Mycobacterium aquaticum TaxID=1927124 RepID=A0A1X0AXY9_9MYCO|nr:hypothetical protein [Mycobacterium aquaticum]ORA34496.1 hypothetical protein BST13_17335 [Mycobacterium aquaticum]